MNVTVLYFARLREAIGRERDVFSLPPEVATVGALRGWLLAQGEPWAGAFAETRRVRAAVNQEMARDDATPLSDGAEVAFFPLVTGG